MPDVVVGEARARTNGISRRRFIGYLIAAPTLVAAADLRAAPPARASVATVQPVDLYDLTDLLTDAAILTASLITVTLNPDGTASFALPRAKPSRAPLQLSPVRCFRTKSLSASRRRACAPLWCRSRRVRVLLGTRIRLGKHCIACPALGASASRARHRRR